MVLLNFNGELFLFSLGYESHLVRFHNPVFKGGNHKFLERSKRRGRNKGVVDVFLISFSMLLLLLLPLSASPVAD